MDRLRIENIVHQSARVDGEEKIPPHREIMVIIAEFVENYFKLGQGNIINGFAQKNAEMQVMQNQEGNFMKESHNKKQYIEQEQRKKDIQTIAFLAFIKHTQTLQKNVNLAMSQEFLTLHTNLQQKGTGQERQCKIPNGLKIFGFFAQHATPFTTE